MPSISFLKSIKLHVFIIFFKSKVVDKYEDVCEKYILLLKLRTDLYISFTQPPDIFGMSAGLCQEHGSGITRQVHTHFDKSNFSTFHDFLRFSKFQNVLIHTSQLTHCVRCDMQTSIQNNNENMQNYNIKIKTQDNKPARITLNTNINDCLSMLPKINSIKIFLKS